MSNIILQLSPELATVPGLSVISLKEVIQVVFLLFLILCSALISGAEVAYFSLSSPQVDALKEEKNHVDSLINRLLSSPKELLASILIFNNLVNISIILVADVLLGRCAFVELSALLAFLVNVLLVTFVLVLFGEIIPKIYAERYNYKFAAFVAKPLFYITRLLSPFAKVMARFSKKIEQKIQTGDYDYSIEELKKAIELTVDEQTKAEDKRMLKEILHFGEINVKQIMIARMDVVALEINTKFSKVLDMIAEYHYSRIPVYEKTFDQIRGFLYIKDLIPYLSEQEFDWQKLIRKPYFAPESKKIDRLLKEFQSKKVHLAIIVDEYGGTSGIVTLEDILEEIVGEINDEFDNEDFQYKQLNENTYLFNAKTLLSDICYLLKLPPSFFEPYKGDAETIGGLLIESFGRIPEVKEQKAFEHFKCEVVSAGRKKINEVKLTLFETTEED